MGCGHALRTTWQGTRTTAADYITKNHKRKNVTITCHVTVDKVIIEKQSDGSLKAVGVEYIGDDGKKHKSYANKEVVLTGGTYGSPAMLLRSGIGPKAHLEELGIPCLVDLPAVGQNLQDHQLIFMYYELNQPGLTDDPRVNHDPNAFENGAKEWKEKKSGWLAQFPFDSATVLMLTILNGVPMSASQAVILWTSHNRSQTWSSSTLSAMEVLLNTLTSPRKDSTHSQCAASSAACNLVVRSS